MAIPNITPPTGAWKTVKDLIADTVGPMAVLGIAAQKFVAASAGAALNAQKMQQALAASEGANKILRQFEALTGSAAAARRQVEMLAKVASGGAFSFESLADASKNLQVLTNGALNTESALKKIQDAAAATGAPVDQMATAVADLYSSLENGSGVDQAADQLKQMGAISNQTAERLKSLSQAGVGLSTTWQVVEADLKKASGAANELASSITGLQQQLATIQQASDIKIGQMFEEGEKAGLRAAIGFQKFTAAVQEANSGPWAAFNAAINSVKESIGGLLGRFAETGAVKTIFQALAVVAIAVLIGVNAAIAGVVVQIGRWIAASVALRGAMAGLGGVVKGFAGFISLASLAASAAATAIIGIGVAALNAENNLRALIAKVKEFTNESDRSASASVAAANNIRSPEDQKNQEDNIDQQLKTLDEAKKNAQQTVEEGRDKKDSLWGLNPFAQLEGGGMIAAGEGVIKDVEKRKKELLELKKKVSGSNAGPDNALFQKEEEQRKQEKEISENARQRIQQGASPAMAKKMAEQQKAKTEAELKTAMDSRENVFKDQKNLNKTSSEFSDGRDKIETARKDYFSAKESNASAVEAEMNRMDPGYKTVGTSKEYQAKLRDNAISNLRETESFRNNESTIEAGLPNENLAAFAAEGFDKARSGAKSESGKLQAERAKREALLQERQSAQEAGDLANRQGDKAGAEDALRRQADVQQQIMRLSDPETGKQLGESALAPDQMRGLDSKINQALEAENDGKKRAADEAAGIQLQATNEAAAADEASKEASERKLTIQKQLAALQGVEGGDGQAAQAELGPEIKQLQEKFNAVKALEAAENAYAEAKASGDKGKIAEAEGNLNQKKTAAARAGAQAGDTSGSIEQEKRGVEQILQIRQQQANIEKAAADARRNEIMQELRLRQQIAQLAFNNATGTTGRGGGPRGGGPDNRSEADMRIADERKTRQRAEEARALVAEREALRASGASPDAEQDLNKKIAALGFDKNTSSQDINSAIKKSQLNEVDLRAQQVEANRNINRDAEIQSLSAQEKYAPSQEARKKAKENREKLEDDAAIEQKTAQYSKTMDQDKAKELATKETELQRLVTRGDEAGTPRVDSLTAVGGGATGFIGANPVDIQKEINKKTEEIAKILPKIEKALNEQTKEGRNILTKLSEE